MTRLEYLSCRVMTGDTAARRRRRHRLLPPCRLGDAVVEAYRVPSATSGRHIHALPDSYQRLSDGDELRVGAHVWRASSPAAAIHRARRLYCPELKLLVSGDQGATHLVQCVGQPDGAHGRPVGDWLASLDKLQRAVPDDVLVLLSHNEPFRGLHAAAAALSLGQQRAGTAAQAPG